MAILFAVMMLLIAAGILVRPGDPRLARILYAIAALIALLLLGGFFGLIGDG